MQTIPQTFTHYRYVLTLIKREGNLVMYGDLAQDYFEVHKVRVQAAREAFGRQLPQSERLAGNADFGRYGWACVGRAHADEVWARESGEVVAV